jgi:mono/diheme cytochrome c family protein
MQKRNILKFIYTTIAVVFSLALVLLYAKSGKSKIDQSKQAVTTVWKAPRSADTLKNPLAENIKAAEKGKVVFQTYCVTCHGDKGKGNGPSSAGLNPKPKDLTLKQTQKQSDGALFWKITTGKPPMVSWKYTLSDKQRWELVDYIRQLAKKGS